MRFNFKTIREKILKGDFSSLFESASDNKSIHPSEVAQMLTNLPTDTEMQAFQSLPTNNQVRVFPYLDLLQQKKIIKNTSAQRAAYILNELSSDDRIIFISSLKGIDLSACLKLLNDANKEAVHNYLGYPANSVARLINTEFATIHKELTIGEAIAHLRGNHKDNETANVIYIVDEKGKLIDDIPVRRFVLNPPEKKIVDILDGFCTSLSITDSKDEAVAKFKEYDRVVLPVINKDHILLGVVTVDDVLDVEEQRATKEIQNFGGLESLDYPYVKTSFFSLIKKRASWLIVLFVGGHAKLESELLGGFREFRATIAVRATVDAPVQGVAVQVLGDAHEEHPPGVYRREIHRGFVRSDRRSVRHIRIGRLRLRFAVDHRHPFVFEQNPRRHTDCEQQSERAEHDELEAVVALLVAAFASGGGCVGERFDRRRNEILRGRIGECVRRIARWRCIRIAWRWAITIRSRRITGLRRQRVRIARWRCIGVARYSWGLHRRLAVRRCDRRGRQCFSGRWRFYNPFGWHGRAGGAGDGTALLTLHGLPGPFGRDAEHRLAPRTLRLDRRLHSWVSESPLRTEPIL